MELNAQIIKKNNKNEFVVLPYNEFLKLQEIIEDYEDLIELRKAKKVDSETAGKFAKDLLSELNM